MALGITQAGDSSGGARPGLRINSQPSFPQKGIKMKSNAWVLEGQASCLPPTFTSAVHESLVGGAAGLSIVNGRGVFLSPPADSLQF